MPRGGPPGVNFTNILHSAFLRADPKHAKRYLQLDLIFTLFGSVCVKALHKTLMQLTPAVIKLKLHSNENL